MAKLANVNMSLCAPAAYHGLRSDFGPALRQRFKCAENALASGTVYGAISIPKGFLLRSIGVNIRTASAVSGSALAIGLDQTSGGNQIIYRSGVSLETAGQFFVDATLPTVALTGAPAATGTVDTTTGAIDGLTFAKGTLAATATLGRTLAGNDYTLTITPTGAIDDADFDIVLMGDQMFGVDDDVPGTEWPVS